MPNDFETILKYQLIPWWERFGMERLVVSEPTLRKFRAQELPSTIDVSVKRRQSRKVRPHGPRIYNNVATISEVFPEDAQDTCRHPILYCVIKGQADLHIADYLVHCPAGHFVLMRPGVSQPDGSRPHLEGTNRNGYCEILHLSLLPIASAVSSHICSSQAGIHGGRQSYTIMYPDMINQLSFFMRETLEQPPGYQKTAFNGLHNFFLLLLRELEAGRLQPSSSTPKRSISLDEDPIDSALQYMESHLYERLTSAKVAKAVFMSRTNFLRHFSRAIDQSFNGYLTKLRLEKAEKLLVGSTLSIQAISNNVGVQPAQLYRIFKAHHGISPSEFRQVFKKKRND